MGGRQLGGVCFVAVDYDSTRVHNRKFPPPRSPARHENCSSTRKIFRRRENFWKTRSDRRDWFRPKIVEIGVILAIFRPFWNFCVERTNCPAWKCRIVLLGNGELFFLEMTNRPAWKWRIMLRGNDESFCFQMTDRLAWKWRIVLLGNDDSTCLETTNLKILLPRPSDF